MLLIAAVVLEGLSIIALGIMVVSLLRGYGEVLTSIGDLRRSGSGARTLSPLLASPRQATAEVHDVIGHSIEGRAIKIGVSGRETNTMLAFLSSGCLTCKTFWEALQDPLQRRAVGAEVVIVTKDAEDESSSTIRKLQPRDVRTVLSTATWHAYDVPGSPYFIYIDGREGRVTGEGSAVTWDQVITMMAQANGDNRLAQGLISKAPVSGDEDEFVESILREAGIGPDHPSLWGSVPPTQPGVASSADRSEETA